MEIVFTKQRRVDPTLLYKLVYKNPGSGYKRSQLTKSQCICSHLNYRLWLRIFKVETRAIYIFADLLIRLSFPKFELVKMFMNTSSAHLDWKMMLRLSGLCFLIAVLTFTQILQSKQLVLMYPSAWP
jgi:hypothetical protein